MKRLKKHLLPCKYSLIGCNKKLSTIFWRTVLSGMFKKTILNGSEVGTNTACRDDLRLTFRWRSRLGHSLACL